ncbi:MAG: hypothetical protein PWP31_1548 [Clostridia bacterium]|nr:hypothetical protein [Clostridia bacterium]
MEFDLSKPIYLQIVNEIKRKIVRRELAPGDKIPSQREMAQKMKVNPNTVQRAYQEMERIELVETLRGQGTFIQQDPRLLENLRNQMAQKALDNFLKEVAALGLGENEIRSMIEEALKQVPIPSNK